MAKKKHDSIYKLYPSVVNIRTTDGVNYQAFDKDGKEVSINKSDIEADWAKQEYQSKRENEYPSVVDQLDDIYHNGIDAWKATIKKTKDKYPK